MAELKLYVWTGLNPCRHHGSVAFAIAETVAEAKMSVQAACCPLCVWDWGTLEIHDIEKCAKCINEESHRYDLE